MLYNAVTAYDRALRGSKKAVFDFIGKQQNHGGAADVVPSATGKLVESIDIDGKTVYISLFTYAQRMLISDNGYRYREGAPLEEYFYNTGKALGNYPQPFKVLLAAAPQVRLS